jgi:hypothetical protein
VRLGKVLCEVVAAKEQCDTGQAEEVENQARFERTFVDVVAEEPCSEEAFVVGTAEGADTEDGEEDIAELALAQYWKPRIGVELDAQGKQRELVAEELPELPVQ